MMRRIGKTKPIFATVLLLGSLAALWWGLGFAKRENVKLDDERVIQLNETNERGEQSSLGPPNEGLSGRDTSVSDFRAAAIARAEVDAGALLPHSEGAKSIARFWFVSDREFYIEYRRQGMATADRMAYVVASGDAPTLTLVRQALYGQGDAGGWELLDGKEVLFTKPQRDLYVKDADGVWRKAN